MIGKELRRLSRLALPMILTQLLQMGMGVADTLMAGRVSAADLAGVAIGGNVFWPVLLFISGIVMSVTPSVSQLHGRGKEHEAGEVVRQALWITLVGGLLLIALLRNAESLFLALGIDPLAIPIAVAYLDALAWGVLPVLFYFAMRYLCEGMSWTLPAMLVALSALLLKVPLNYLFIYGHESIGLPAMGGVGCGWSSAIVMTYEMLAMGLIVAFSRMRRTGVFHRVSLPNRAEIARLVRLGLPIGATTFLEFSVFSVMTLLIGRLGVDAVAAHQITSNVAGLTFMIPLGIGMAATVRVGFNVGAGDLPGARLSANVAVGASWVFAVLAAATVYSTRFHIAGLYSTDATVIAVAAELMLFVAVYQLFDDSQVACIGSLRGFKDTRTPMWVAIMSYWLVGFPISVVLGFGLAGAPDLGVAGFWWGLVVGLAVAAAVLLWRLRWLLGNDARVRELALR
ncbi:MAG: MATE family efflux transporter [Pseudomonadales bacterium]|nr:MATE family efflux transporter [Pseudomonadales bacterium]MDP6972509.1 MATE family efflux transporter [Pseudomonadales bacterium]